MIRRGLTIFSGKKSTKKNKYGKKSTEEILRWKNTGKKYWEKNKGKKNKKLQKKNTGK
jgi:hypothetical protein